MVKSQPFFSIIIPTLNEELYLPHLLRDLSTQTYHDFEVIIVDGNSDDQTVVKANELRSSIPRLTIINSPRRHVCTQRNLGSTNALGQVLLFIDADTRLPSFFLLGIKFQLESHPAELATTFVFTSSPEPYELSIISTINTATELSRKMDTPLFSEGMTIISKDLFTKINGFNESINFSEGTDIIHKARKLGVEHYVYHEPRYEYSLRRIKQFGALKIVANIGQHQLSKLLGIEMTPSKTKELYPMEGGSLFHTPPKSRVKAFTLTIDKLLRNFTVNDKPLTLKILKKQMDSLLS